jgi:hypothetical protein
MLYARQEEEWASAVKARLKVARQETAGFNTQTHRQSRQGRLKPFFVRSTPSRSKTSSESSTTHLVVVLYLCDPSILMLLINRP